MSLPSIPPPLTPPGLPSIDPPALPPIPPAPPVPPEPTSAGPAPSLPEAPAPEIPEPAAPPTPPAMPETPDESVAHEEMPQTVEGAPSSAGQEAPEVVSENEEKTVVEEPKDMPVEEHTPSLLPSEAPLSRGDSTAEQPQVIEKIVEKTVPAEVTDADKDRIFNTRLAALSVKGNAARSKRLQDNHAKIIEYLKQHGYATNNEVEKLCHVADSTATRYLKSLERQGVVMQVGKRGKNLRWRLREARP